MSRYSEAAVRPRNGHTLIVGVVCRISGCANQKELSLQDQEDNAKEAVKELYDGPAEFDVIATVGKGEALDRPELERIEKAMRSGKYDLFIFDDLSRLIRGGEAARLLGVGVDHGTRSICLNDGIDTIESTWEQDALNACSESVAHNEATSKRIKTKTANRFKKFGWPTGRPTAGYIVPEGARSYDDWQKDEAATPVIQAGKKILKADLDYAPVADFFNEQQFPVGPYCRLTDWNGAMVRRLYSNTLLKGKPQRGAKHTVKKYVIGRRVSVKNPKGPTYYNASHLAHLNEEEFDELQKLLAAAHAHHGRPKLNGVDPLLGRPRNHSQFPGMHSKCWYCGHHHVWGGNGITENLMCNNSRTWHCWHSIGFSGPKFAEKLVAAICSQLPRLDEFDQQFAALVANADTAVASQFADSWALLRHDEYVLAKEKANLIAAIKDFGHRPMLAEVIKALEAEEGKLLLRRHKLERRREERLELPESASALRGMLEEEFCRLTIESLAFGSLMRSLAPEIYVYAVRLCDGGHLLPRAKIRLNLAGTFPDVNLVPGLGDLLTQDLTLDLFDPPQRERIREAAVHLAAGGLGPNAIAREIAEKPTSTAVQNALALQSKMISLGLDSPYVMVFEPPADYRKLRRHRNARYQFKPRDGYQRPSL
jgi:site-specific DNA recombinase